MSITSKGGDKGETSLMFGKRVNKFCTRVSAYGSVDELSAALGLARAYALEANPKLAKEIFEIQNSLIKLMTELATDSAEFSKLSKKNIALISKKDITKIEAKILKIESESAPSREWKIAGDTKLDAALNLSRTACRKAERKIALLNSEEALREILPAYINRLSDLIFLFSSKA